MADYKYQRVLLKLSGEALMGEQDFGIDPAVPQRIAEAIKPAYDDGVQIAVVVGGGNIYRGLEGAAEGMDRAQGDNMGMLATVINSLALQDCFEKNGIDCRVMSAIEMHAISETYIRRRAIRHLEKGRITIFAAGTGNPYFTTDTCAALRACEIGAEVLMKATKVDGIYDKDPGQAPRCQEVRHHHLPRRAQVAPAGDGCHGHGAVPGQPHAHHGVQHGAGRRHRACAAWRAGGHDRRRKG